MYLENGSHLTYCTNIHPGETWEEVFGNLKKYCLEVKNRIIPDKKFGIGLRLSQKSASTLLLNDNLLIFKNWLDSNNMYVFTMNGFPYGDFHNVEIKDKVHLPDWTTEDRINYTKDLFKILNTLLPENVEGGISTSPLSYKLWFEEQDTIDEIKSKTCDSLIQIVVELIKTKALSNKSLHLDIEPEPDGVLENTNEVIAFFNDYLLVEGVHKLTSLIGCSSQEAKESILEHIQLCYDVCHFALAYEDPKEVVASLEEEGIKIGKVQISAAMKCVKSDEISIVKQQDSLRKFDEPTYLHQAIVRTKDGDLKHFSDLGEGIESMGMDDFEEIRTHFHVPVFVDRFEELESTQDEIIKALEIWKTSNYCKHLEVETYTWGVLPDHLQIDMTGSIVRELNWVLEQI